MGVGFYRVGQRRVTASRSDMVVLTGWQSLHGVGASGIICLCIVGWLQSQFS